jgi:hypothetical protein
MTVLALGMCAGDAGLRRVDTVVGPQFSAVGGSLHTCAICSQSGSGDKSLCHY